MRRATIFIFGLLVIAVGIIPATASAFQTNVQGYIETLAIVRDTDGFQYGFMDETQWVQWKNEIQFDVEMIPEYTSRPSVRLEKAFLRYRVGYDAVIDLVDRYDDIREKSPDDFELGKDDIRVENQLKELFVDFVAESSTSPTRANLRLGRQIVQWGESDIFALMNIVNPTDRRKALGFTDYDILLAPLWMARFDLSLPPAGAFDTFNVQLLAIPDKRPTQLAPLDGMYNAPYAFFLKGLAPVPVKEDIDEFGVDDMEVGVRLGAEIGGWTLFAYYLDSFQDGGALDFRTAFTIGAYTFRHPKQKTYGFSFSKFVNFGNIVLRGEGSLTEDTTQTDLATLAVGGPGYSEHDKYQALVGIDKSFSAVVPGTDSALSTSLQVYYSKIDDWDENMLLGRTAPEELWQWTLMLMTDFYHGSIAPTIVLWGDSEDALYFHCNVNWSPDGRFYVNLGQTSYFGDKDGQSAFAPFINTFAEVALKVGYRF